MINIVVCDDDALFLERICIYIDGIFEKYKIKYRIASYDLPQKLMKGLSEGRTDILLLDIDMPGISGMEIAAKLNEEKESVLLIFVTSYEAFVYDTFQYQPFDFIRKSRYEKDLGISLERAVRQLSNEKTEYTLKTSGSIIRIPLAEILYFESCANYVRVVTASDEYKEKKTIHEIENELNMHGFIRLHRGYLVNQAAVYILKSDRVIISNQEALPIGRHWSVSAKEALLRYMR